MTDQIKARIGNSVLIVWLVAGIVGGIQVINWIPIYFGDKAGVLLPAYVIALVVILFVGRFAIERWLKRYFAATTDAPILRASTESVMRTGTSFAVSIVVTVGAIVTTGPIIVEAGQDNPASSDAGICWPARIVDEESASADLNVVYVG